MQNICPKFFQMTMTTEGDYHTPFGYSLHYRVDGNGAEKVFLVIGFSSCGAYWGPLVDAIHFMYPGRYTTCIYDQRGVGKSTTRAFEKCSTTTIARDMLGLLLHLDWIGKQTPLHLIGWSMGGFASIEFVNMLLREIGGLLNLTSLTLCNTGHKLTFPAAKALIPGFRCLGKGILSLLFGIPTKWMVEDILKVHYSPSYLDDQERYQKLVAEYETRSPFNTPMSQTAVALLQHIYAVLTHYVPRSRMKAIRESGLPIHAVVSSEDLLIHPTASITLARYLNCDFSYLPGGHMSHCIHTDIIIEKLVSVWDAGLSRKFPHYRKPNQPLTPAMPRTMSLTAGKDLQLAGSTISPGKVIGSLDWPMGEPMILDKLKEVMMNRMDRWTIWSLISRLKKPGRLIIAPALVLPIVIIQLRKIFCVPSIKKRDRLVEAGLLFYIFILIFVVQEVTRGEG